MRKPYRFTLRGHGSGGATFETSGTMVCEFNDSFGYAMEETFRQLTNGRAVYGEPGVGCRGPYGIRSLLIEEVAQ